MMTTSISNQCDTARKHEQGFTLVELMVALAIGLFLLAGAASMFANNKRIYTEQDQMSRLQENARFAMHLISEDIRMSGHSGCSHRRSAVANNLNGGTTNTNTYYFQTPVEGSESAADWQPNGSNDQISNMVSATDGLTVRYLQPIGTNVTAAMTTVTSAITVDAPNIVRQNDIIAISDCTSADIFMVTNANPSTDGFLSHASGTAPDPFNSTSSFSRTYGTNAQLMRVVTRRYFIGDGTNGPSLFLRSGSAAAEELFEGVEDMQILYGEDNSGDDDIVDRYVEADNVSNWEDVVSIRIGLLMRTVNEYRDGNDTDTYNVNGTVVDPVDDRRRRRVFSTTIEVRNKTEA